MRAANKGFRVTYDTALSIRARFVRATLLLGAAGITLSQLGPWGADARARITEQIDRVVPHRYANVQPQAVTTDPAVPDLPGYDVKYAIDGDPGRAWGTAWRPPAAAGEPCRRPGGAAALLVTFGQPTSIDRVVFRGGLAKGNDTRTLQARPRRLDVLFSDGTCAVADLGDDAGPQKVGAKAAAVTNARVVIVDVYPPADGGESLVSLSEVSFERRK